MAPSASWRAWLLWLSVGLALLTVVLLALYVLLTPSPDGGTKSLATLAPPPQPLYVGGKECAACHAKEHAAWAGSQHDRAMQRATEAAVLGDFGNAKFSYAGITTTFFRRDGKFFVNTDGADGKLADFEISHTFGVEPLQQYLIDFPDGRKQALGIAWDSRPKAQGGQRWFHLYQGQKVKAGDRLHWTNIDQNWNYQCADCHSTNVRKNFDETTNTFKTTWTDINVNCEACHGPGSNHLAWARKESGWNRFETDKGLAATLDERHGITWTADAATGNSVRSRTRVSAREIEVCARCHSRRGQFSDEHVAGQPLTDAFRPALLERGLYHVDGQMLDEVYNHASFLQSKMNARGVTCSDCHDPHSQKLRARGNGVCALCHQAEKYDAAAHHHHAPQSKGASCAACHMPTTTYMVIDPRHDHSMRIPRPDLSAKLETPNACNNCHADKKPAWAAAAVGQWFPDLKPGFQDFAEVFAAADLGEPAAISRLSTIAVNREERAVVRASAVSRLARHIGPATLPALRKALDDPDAMVRAAAVAAIGGTDLATRANLLGPLLDDPARLVRMDAARELAGTSVDQGRLGRATTELLAALRFNADRPDAHLALGNLAEARGDFDGARAEFGKALAIDPGFIEAAINLADLHRARGDEKLAEETLRTALKRDPASATSHHALGLVLVRQKRLPEALSELSRAVALAPGDARFAYVYAVALFDSGSKAQAMTTLDAALARNANDRDLLYAATTYRRESGDASGALRFARRLLALEPDNAQVRQLVGTLEAVTR